MTRLFAKTNAQDRPVNRSRWITVWFVSLTSLVLLMMFLLVSGSIPVAAQEQTAPNITFVKSVTPGSASFGGIFTFTLQITNNATTTISTSNLWDTFPGMLSVINVLSTGPSDSYLVNAGVVNVSLIDILPQQTRTITIVAKVQDYPTAVPGTYSNFANINIAGTILQSNTINYQILGGNPNFTLQKRVTPVATGIGGIFTFTVQIRNNAGDPGSNLLFSDSFPKVLTILRVATNDQDDNQYLPDAQSLAAINAASVRTIAFNLSDIPGNGGRQVFIVAQVNALAKFSANYTNVAYLSDANNTWQSNAAAYQILTDLLLPPTGGMEIDRSIASRFGMLLVAGLILAGMGGAALFQARRVKAREPQLAARMVLGSTVLLVVGLALSMAACTARVPTPVAKQIAPAAVHAVTPQVAVPAEPEVGGSIVADPPSQSTVLPEEDAMDYPDPIPPAVAGAQDGSLDLTPIQRVIIPALGLDAPVRFIPFNGTTWRVDTLESQIAWLGDTGWPGLGGNIGLAGHVSLNDGSDGPFRNLSRLKAGDLVEIYTTQKVYTFKISQLAKVGSGDISVVTQTDGTHLTLITCADWDKQLQSYLSRLVVSSELVEVHPVPRTTSN